MRVFAFIALGIVLGAIAVLLIPTVLVSIGAKPQANNPTEP